MRMDVEKNHASVAFERFEGGHDLTELFTEALLDVSLPLLFDFFGKIWALLQIRRSEVEEIRRGHDRHLQDKALIVETLEPRYVENPSFSDAAVAESEINISFARVRFSACMHLNCSGAVGGVYSSILSCTEFCRSENPVQEAIPIQALEHRV